jgi:hypothetical protein
MNIQMPQHQCTNCDFFNDLIDDPLSPVIHGIPHISVNTRDLLDTTLVTELRLVCPECIYPLTNIISYNHFLKLLVFAVGGHNIGINKYIKIRSELTCF